MGAAAPSTLTYDPTAGELPPQAPAPAATFADQNDIAPAAPAQDIVRTAAFGDQGAQQYQALVNAGTAGGAANTPPPPPAPAAGPAGLAGMANMPVSAIPVPPGSNPSSPIANALISLSGGDPYKNDLERVRLMQEQQGMQIAAQREMRENASEFYTQLVPSIFKAFPGRPDLAANTLVQQAAARGIQVDPTYLMKLNQDFTDGQMTPAQINAHIWDPNTPASTVMRLGPMADSLNKTFEAAAHASTAITQAQSAPAKEAATVAMHIRQAQRPPTLEEGQSLDAAGMAAWTVPMPGVKGATMWVTGPKSAIPQGANVFDPRAVESARAKAAGEQTAARTAAGPVPATITDKLSNFDLALDLIKQLKQLYVKGGPTDQERQSWLARVGQEFKYQWGFDQPDNLDEDTALRSLGAITAGRAFIQGRPNQQMMTEIWKHTGQNPLVSPQQMRDRLDIMDHAVTTQKQRMIDYAKSGRGDLDAVSDAEASATGHTGAGPATPLSDWLSNNP